MANVLARMYERAPFTNEGELIPLKKSATGLLWGSPYSPVFPLFLTATSFLYMDIQNQSSGPNSAPNNRRIRTAVVWSVLAFLMLGVAVILWRYAGRVLINLAPVQPSLSLRSTPLLGGTSAATSTVSSTQAHTAIQGWKTYQNLDYSFAFEYPQGWMAKEGKMPNYPLAGTSSFYVNVYEPPLGEHSARSLNSLGVTVYDNPYLNSSSTLESALEESARHVTDEGTSSYRIVRFDSDKAYYEYEPGIASGYNLLMEHDSKIYDISLGPRWPDLTSASGTVKEILDTFRFLK